MTIATLWHIDNVYKSLIINSDILIEYAPEELFWMNRKIRELLVGVKRPKLIRNINSFSGELLKASRRFRVDDMLSKSILNGSFQ